jgi:ArpU family phage transcriptional regulator
MTQLAFWDVKISKETRRKAEKLMSMYKNIEAIIEAKRLDLNAKTTATYEPMEGGKTNAFHSETERLTLLKLQIEDYERIKRKLDYVFYSLKPIQQKIWEQRYLQGKYDVDVHNDLKIPPRTYYKLKKEMIAVVAEAFGLQNKDIKKL